MLARRTRAYARAAERDSSIVTVTLAGGCAAVHSAVCDAPELTCSEQACPELTWMTSAIAYHSR